MHVVTITAKRQTPLPAALCEELGLAPGAKVAVERRLVGKETVWVLKGPGPDWSWVGSPRRYAKGKSHRLSDIRRSIVISPETTLTELIISDRDFARVPSPASTGGTRSPGPIEHLRPDEKRGPPGAPSPRGIAPPARSST